MSIMSELDIEMYKALVNEATENAVKFIKKQEKERFNKKHDRRLHNTELLLRNFNNIKEHSENSTYMDNEITISKLKELKDAEDEEDVFVINSILKTKKRSEVMIKHIEKFLEYYELKCLNSNKEDVQRRIKVIKMLYIDIDDKTLKTKTMEEVAEILYVDPRTVRNYKKEAIKELSVLFFGIDGINLY